MGHSRAIFGSLGRLFLAFALGTAAACGTSDGTLSDGRQSPGDAHGNDARGADALINADAVVLDGPLNDVDAQLPIDAPASAIDAHVFIDAGPPPAQLTWTPVSAATPPTAAYSVSVYDSARNRVVNFDGADTTVWNGSTWVSLLPPTSPSDNTRSQFAMGYDPVRDRIVLFGGIGSDVHGDTWEFDGETWAQAAPATSPNARWDAGFVFDGATDRSLVFGGSTFIAIDSGNAQVAINDGWEYDGATWTQVTAVGDVMPSNLSGSGNVNAVAYDSLRNQVIEFGGDFSSGNDAPGQTWAFDGTQWTQLSPDNSPPERSPCRLVYDSARDRVVLFGGGFGNPYPDDVWEFDGTTWTEATPTPSPTPRFYDGFVYDQAHGYTLVHGGSSVGSLEFPQQVFPDTWSWDGSSWTDRTAAPVEPNLQKFAMAYDPGRQRVVMFGGENVDEAQFNLDTWEWDGAVWTRIATVEQPGARNFASMAYDSASGAIVVFGGENAFGLLSDMWSWDGSSWKQLAQTDVWPNAVSRATMVSVPDQNLIMMFGGIVGSDEFSNQTWVWSNGATWSVLPTDIAPPARFQTAMAYDPIHQQVALIGGVLGDGSAASDFWLFDPLQLVWSASQSTAPTARSAAAMAYVPTRNAVILFGGLGPGSKPEKLGDTWEWDGTAWTQDSPDPEPASSDLAGLVFDEFTDSGVLVTPTEFWTVR